MHHRENLGALSMRAGCLQAPLDRGKRAITIKRRNHIGNRRLQIIVHAVFLMH